MIIMKFSMNSVILSSLLLVMIIIQVKENEASAGVSAVRGMVMSSFYIPMPLGPIIGGITYLISEAIIEKTSDQDAPSFDSEIFTEKMNEMSNKIDEQADRIIDALDTSIFDHTIGENLRNSLDHLYDDDDLYALCMIHNSFTCTPEDRDKVLDDLTNSRSNYRVELSNFIEKYIDSSSTAVDVAFGQKEFILDRMAKTYKKKIESNRDCYNSTQGGQSLQVKIFDVTAHILSVLTKAYAMVILAHQEKYNLTMTENTMTGNKAKTILIARNYYRDVIHLLEETETALTNISRDIRPCDPPVYKRRVNYDCITNLVQPIVLEDKNSHSPNNLPRKFRSTNRYNFNALTKEYPWITWCDEGHADDIRALGYPAVKNDERNYYLIIEKTSFLGTITKYGRTDIKENDIEFDQGLLNPVLCYTDMINGTNTVRRFSLQPVQVSRKDYVVTGVRFVIKNKIVYIEIQQGLLVNGSYVDPKTVVWQNANENSNFTKVLHRTNRGVNFDDVILPPGSFVTGVQFTEINRNLTLKVYGVIGEEKNQDTVATPHLNDPERRREIVLREPDLSELAPHNKPHEIISQAGRSSMIFRATDFKKDASQTTVPYLDIQEVITNPPSPIGGIGMYYKGMAGYGGFIGLKLLSVDVVYDLHIDLFKKHLQKIDNIYQDAEKSHSSKKKQSKKNSKNNIMDLLNSS